MNWDELSPEQKNALIAKKVMGWKPGACDGEIGEKSISPDGWYCQKCGHSGYWGDDQEHEQVPPRYTTDMNAAWKIAEKMVARMGWDDLEFKWRGPIFKPEYEYLTTEGYPLSTTCWYVHVEFDGKRKFICADTPQEAICKAALKSLGVEI